MRRSRLLGGSGLLGVDSGQLLRAPRRMLPSQYERIVLADSPAAYYPLVGGTTDADRSGNSYDLTWSGTTPGASPQMLSGVVGGVSLGGASLSRYPSASNTSAFVNVRSIEAWVKFASTADMAIVSARNVGNQFALYHDNTNKLRLLVGYNSGVLVSSFATSIDLADGALHHIVCTFGTSLYVIYVDGVSRTSSTLFAPSFSTNDYLTVGSEGGPSRRWDGYLGHVALYNSNLSAEQVAAHHSAGRALFR